MNDGPDLDAVLAFLRRLREGLDAGLELPEAVTRGATVLPRDARSASVVDRHRVRVRS